MRYNTKSLSTAVGKVFTEAWLSLVSSPGLYGWSCGSHLPTMRQLSWWKYHIKDGTVIHTHTRKLIIIDIVEPQKGALDFMHIVPQGTFPFLPFSNRICLVRENISYSCVHETKFWPMGWEQEWYAQLPDHVFVNKVPCPPSSYWQKNGNNSNQLLKHILRILDCPASLKA